MTEAEYQRFNKRINRYGFTHEEAYHCPKNTPLWMYRVEREEGMSFAEIVKLEIARGVSYSQIARSIGQNIATVYHWIRKFRQAGAI